MARVVPLGERASSRFGFLPEGLARETRVPDDFDTLGSDEIAGIFGLEG